MKISIEISMYPLDSQYGTHILKFLASLRECPGLEVRSNSMSTQIFGEYDTVMAALTQEMKTAFETEMAVAMVMKVVNLNLTPG